MSAENVAIVRSCYEAFAAGDIPAFLGRLAPDIEWIEDSSEFLPFHGAHHGPEAIVNEVFVPVLDHFDDFAVLPERFHDAGDVVVVEGRVAGRSKATGKSLDARTAWVWTVRQGKVVGNVNYHDTDAFRVCMS